MWGIFWFLVGGLVGSAVLAFFGSFVLQGATRLVVKSTLDPNEAYITSLYATVGSFLVTSGIGFGFAKLILDDESVRWSLQGVAIILSFILCTFLVHVRHRFEIVRAAMIVLVCQVIWAVIAAIMWGGWVGGKALISYCRAWLNGEI